jgi:hypothetical protein
MSRYLEEAADILRAASRDLEENAKTFRGDFQSQRVELANGFAALAAIERGLLPASVVEAVVEAILARNTP